MNNTLDATARSEVIEKLAQILNEFYVFPHVAQMLGAHVRTQRDNGSYDSVEDGDEFARSLTGDMQNVASDLHLSVEYDPESAADLERSEREGGQRDEEHEKRFLKRQRYDNFGFERVERLKGNVGYLDLRGFAPPQYAGETAIAAMNFLAHSNAIIFDLRRNGGGDPAMIQLLTTYLFAESKHLNSFYWRPSDSYQQFWTLPHVPGKRLTDALVYVLTSRYTFSGAEEFTYNLKIMERATIIGETTGGGAHPVLFKPLVQGFIVNVPAGRAINPITGTNWEGVGVTPDINVPESEALVTAHLHAVTHLIEKATDPDEKQLLSWKLEALHAEYAPTPVDESLLRQYEGLYGTIQIVAEDGNLYHLLRGLKERLTPIQDDLFMVNKVYKLRFLKDDDGRVTGFLRLDRDGREVRIKRSG
jgi:hypothetical protein